MLRISRTRLDQEFVTPRVEVLECVGSCCVEDKDAAVSASVESNTERLEAFWNVIMFWMSHRNFRFQNCVILPCPAVSQIYEKTRSHENFGCERLNIDSPASSQRGHRRRLPLWESQRRSWPCTDWRSVCSRTGSSATFFPRWNRPKWWPSTEPSFSTTSWSLRIG